MSGPSIRAEHLSKQYRITRVARSRNDGGSGASGLWQRARRAAEALKVQKPSELVWALHDVSFDVQQGEVIGIIGRNGAGKSTLLKVLARITEPTSGRAILNGRVGSLLEVGTGFHPELTGRENLYLSGAILGMRRAEVNRKFDEIVAFAEVERFLDTPVKRYSSGMYVRLAFAVAAHLEPEILLVDEVLAVGDAVFQKKCLGKMGDVATEGRTVLFVSHNLVAIQNLCQRALWVDAGRVGEVGPAGEVVAHYLASTRQAQTESTWEDPASAPGNERVRVRRIRVRPESGAPNDAISMDRPTVVEVEYWNLLPDSQLHVCWHFLTDHQVVAFTSASNELDPPGNQPWLAAGLYRSTCRIPGNLLNEGSYRLNLLLLRDGRKITYRLNDALSFDVVESGARAGSWFGREPGVLRPALEWTTEALQELAAP